MKKILLLTLISLSAFGQTHLKNQKFFQMNIGKINTIDRYNYNIELIGGKYNKKTNGNAVGVAINQRNVNSNSNPLFLIPVKQYLGFYRTEFKLYKNPSNTLFFRWLGSCNIGYESINSDKKQQNNFYINTPSSSILGVGSGLEFDILNFTIGVKGNYNFITSNSKFSAITYFGYRVHFK